MSSRTSPPASLEGLFEGLDIGAPAGFARADACALTAVLALLAVSDQILTSAERESVLAELCRQWAIEISASTLDRVFERVTMVQARPLLSTAGDRARQWDASRRRDLGASLLAIIASDGNVSVAEHQILSEFWELLGFGASELEALEVDVGAGDEAEVLARVPLRSGEGLWVGRSIAMDVWIPRAPISSRQARLELVGKALEIRNIGFEGVMVHRGKPLGRKVVLEAGEEVRFGRYRLRFESDREHIAVLKNGVATKLTARGVGYSIPFRGRERGLLRSITFEASAGEMIAVIGPSGCGKSTLLALLAGILEIDAGRLELDSMGIVPGVEAVTRRISFVPQDDLLYSLLTVEESVATSARLKGLEAQIAVQYRHLVEEILEKLGLDDEALRASLIGDETTRGVSGGQRKRVSVAQELVGDDTDVLLLDEPTSGLDPRNEANVVAMLREIADGGKLVITTTHSVSADTVHLYDKVLCLSGDGHCAFFGSPRRLLDQFGIERVSRVFELLESWQPPENDPDPAMARRAEASKAVSNNRPLDAWAQVRVLLARQSRLRLRDRTSFVLAIFLPVAVVSTLKAIYLPNCLEASSLLILGLAALWAGASVTVRDLISDFPIIRHEVRSRTTLLAVYLSKVITAMGLSLGQAGLISLLLFPLLGVENIFDYAGWHRPLENSIIEVVNLVSPVHLFVILFIGSLAGNALGMLLSSMFRSATAAIFTMPLILLPLVVSAGSLVPPRDIPEWLDPVVAINPLFWTYSGLLASQANTCQPFANTLDLDDDWADAKEERTQYCETEETGRRRIVPPDDLPSPSRPVFQQPLVSCVSNLYLGSEDLHKSVGLRFEEPSSGDPVDRLQIERFVDASTRLMMIILGLHTLAFLCVARRLRRRS